jgi:hypothetical protein
MSKWVHVRNLQNCPSTLQKRTVLGDTLSDADNEGDLGLESLLDTGGGQRRTEKNC